MRFGFRVYNPETSTTKGSLNRITLRFDMQAAPPACLQRSVAPRRRLSCRIATVCVALGVLVLGIFKGLGCNPC